MADKDNVNNNIIKYNIEEKKKETEIPRKLEIQNSQISEEELTGDAAICLYDLLFNPKPDPKKKDFIKKALQLFPEPEKSKELEIAL